MWRPEYPRLEIGAAAATTGRAIGESPVLRVLIVEDQHAAAEVLATYVERVVGLRGRRAGRQRVGLPAAAGRRRGRPDPARHLPAGHVRAGGAAPDPGRRLHGRRDRGDPGPRPVGGAAAVSFGAMQYLVKPFTFATVRQKLERYQEYRSMLAENDLVLAQQEVDRLMHTLRESAADDLPKGISSESLQVVVAALRKSGETTRAVRGRGGRLVRLVPGDRAALPGVPGRLGCRGAQRALPQLGPTRDGVPAGAAGRPRPSGAVDPLVARDPARVQPDLAANEAARPGRGDEACAGPRPGTVGSARSPGAWPASCSPSRRR